MVLAFCRRGSVIPICPKIIERNGGVKTLFHCLVGQNIKWIEKGVAGCFYPGPPKHVFKTTIIIFIFFILKCSEEHFEKIKTT